MQSLRPSLARKATAPSRPTAQPYCFLSGTSLLSTENILLDAITQALRVNEADDWSHRDSELGQNSLIGTTGDASLPGIIKDALRVSEEAQWTRDLVMLKWHGVLVETDDSGDDSDDWFEQEDDRVVELRNAIVPNEVRVHSNLRPDGPIPRHGPSNFVIHINTSPNNGSPSSPQKIAIGRYDEAHTFVTRGSFAIAQMATNGRLTPYALFMLQFDLRGLGADIQHEWETATEPPATSIRRDYYIGDQFSADLQCNDCAYEMGGSGLRSVDYGPMARTIKTRVDLLSLPLSHSQSHQDMRSRRNMYGSGPRRPSEEQQRYWQSIFGSLDMDENAKIGEAWMGSGNLWCLRRPDRFPIENALVSLPLLTFDDYSSRGKLARLEALPLPIFQLLTSYLSPKDFMTLLFLSKSLHASLLPNIDKLVYASIRETRPHLLPSTPLKFAGHRERRSKEEEYWVLEWAKGGIHLGLDDKRNWRSAQDVDEIPWMRYARAAARCPSMRNRRRIWGIALQLEELAERAGYL